MTITPVFQSKTSNMHELKKELAIQFAQNLRKHSIILDKNVFVETIDIIFTTKRY